MTLESTLTLPNSSVKLPVLGFGVWESRGDTCVKSCKTALENGYRHIDTAQVYGNESQVGEALRQSGVKRSDVFITSKILSPGSTDEQTYEKIAESVKKIDDRSDGYVDLMLIHNANVGAEAREKMWKAMEKALKEGITKAIGVSNYGGWHIDGMKKYATTWPPHVNQIEVCFTRL